MGDRKKEDDIALTLRNLSMSKTIKKSREVERSMQLRIIEAKMEQEKESKLAAKMLNPDQETVESNISSDDCEHQEAKYNMLNGEARTIHLMNLWKRAYLKGKGGSLVLHFYKDLSRKIYLFGLSKKLEDIEMELKPNKFVI